jgi:hypothetical protein
VTQLGDAGDAAWRQVKNDQAPVDEQRRLPVLGLHCCAISFSGANPHGVLDFRDENLAVANLASARRLHDRIDDPIDEIGGNHDFNLDLWKKAHRIFGAAMNLGMPFLVAESHDLVTFKPETPTLITASSTSSSLNGWMMATTRFMG